MSPTLILPRGSNERLRCVKGHRDLRHFKDGKLWICSACGKREPWSESWGYFGNIECTKCMSPAIEYVVCSDACRAQLEART